MLQIHSTPQKKYTKRFDLWPAQQVTYPISLPLFPSNTIHFPHPLLLVCQFCPHINTIHYPHPLIFCLYYGSVHSFLHINTIHSLYPLIFCLYAGSVHCILLYINTIHSLHPLIFCLYAGSVHSVLHPLLFVCRFCPQCPPHSPHEALCHSLTLLLKL